MNCQRVFSINYFVFSLSISEIESIWRPSRKRSLMLRFRGVRTVISVSCPWFCSDRAENTRNRKIWFFCFRALSRFFFNSKKKYFFDSKKNVARKFWNFPKSEKIQWKITIFFNCEAENPYLSIARVFSSIRATRRDWQAFMCRTPSKLQNCYFFTIRSSHEEHLLWLQQIFTQFTEIWGGVWRSQPRHM